MILKCAVVDDEPLALELMASYVEKTPFLSLEGRYSSAPAAMAGISSSPVDLIFLDIQMPQLSGLDFSRMLDKRTRVVFTTAFGEYAIDSYRVNALDYLLKPVSYQDFLAASNKALEWFSREDKESDGYVFVKSEYRYIQLRLSEILYIEGFKDYVRIWMEGSAEPVLTQMSMKSVEELLPSRSFMRVHKSYIVRKDKVRVVERNRIIFGDRRIPVGDSYKDVFQSFLDNR